MNPKTADNLAGSRACTWDSGDSGDLPAMCFQISYSSSIGSLDIAKRIAGDNDIEGVARKTTINGDETPTVDHGHHGQYVREICCLFLTVQPTADRPRIGPAGASAQKVSAWRLALLQITTEGA